MYEYISISRPMVTHLHFASDRIRLCRELAKLRQSDCERYGIGLGTYKKWEKSEQITEKAAKKLSSMFSKAGVKVSYRWLLDGIGEDLPEKIDLPMPKNRSVIHQELQHFKHLNRNKKVIARYVVDPIGKFFDIDDLVAGFITYDKHEVLEQLCIIQIPNDMYHIDYIKKIDFEKKICAVQPKDSDGRNKTIKFEEIAKIVWLRKK